MWVWIMQVSLKSSEIFEQTLGTKAEIVEQFLDVTQDAASECVKYAHEVNANAIHAIGGVSLIPH